jgi:pimeloyl-ACP methyl ester carboxylesterase
LKISTDDRHVAKFADGTEVHFAVCGDRRNPAVFMGPHFYVSQTEPDESFTDSWIDRLQREFFLILADYPRGIGLTGAPQGLAYSPDVAVEEYELIADAVGVSRFGWLGYSFGGAMGIQLACRTDRVAALAVGGFPPLNAPFQRIIDIVAERAKSTDPLPELIDPGVLDSTIGFYTPLVNWPEREEIPRLNMPRLVFMGVEDGMPEDERELPLSDKLRAVENELRMLGWRIGWLPGENHSSAIRPEASLPLVQAFFRETLCER